MMLLKLATKAGWTHTFEPNGPRLWDQVRSQLIRFLTEVYLKGGLRGSQASDAFGVQCDETTMTQQDQDQGRIIANIWYQPVAPVEIVNILLSESNVSELQG